ncbi:MAG: MGMT family protein [Gammaproteobacteria bacterium]|nr:MGMT family protein [Gammaproteobacteria bacterium]
MIPEGRVASYGQVADLAGLPGRARLVGKVLRQSSPEHQLQWHRVLRSNGQLAFEKFSKQAQEQKELLLSENISIKNNRVDLKVFQWCPSLDDILLRMKH